MAAHIDRWDDILVDEAAETWSPPRNMVRWVDFLVFDILDDLCFGEEFNAKELRENKLKQIPHLIMKHVKLGYMVSKSSLLDLVLFLQPRGLGALQERIRHVDMKSVQWFFRESCEQAHRCT
jgi:hypothetical protein